MSTTELHSLNSLTLSVWTISPHTEELVFVDTITWGLIQAPCFSLLRKGIFSTHAQSDLAMYLSDLRNRHDIVEILTVCREGEAAAMVCRLSIHPLSGSGDIVLFRDTETPASQGLKASRPANYQRKKQGFYARSFQINSAPTLLIDPPRDRLIVDANLNTLSFHDCSHDVMCQKHTWEINTPGRHILPVMHEIACLPGGHKFLYLIHKLADGTSRHVQTYAGLIEIYGNRLMLCTIHDITEQERLEQEPEHAALRDALTGSFNRRHFYQVTEPEQTHVMSPTQDYSPLLIDTDCFKSISDLFDHLKGNKVLCALARTLEPCAKKDDLIFRWGGEEFTLLLPRTSLDTVPNLTEVIRATVAKVALLGPPHFTVSIDVARHEIDESIDELFKHVDGVLYKAKSEGRNRMLAA